METTLDLVFRLAPEGRKPRPRGGGPHQHQGGPVRPNHRWFLFEIGLPNRMSLGRRGDTVGLWVVCVTTHHIRISINGDLQLYICTCMCMLYVYMHVCIYMFSGSEQIEFPI